MCGNEVDLAEVNIEISYRLRSIIHGTFVDFRPIIRGVLVEVNTPVNTFDSSLFLTPRATVDDGGVHDGPTGDLPPHYP